MSTSFVSSSEVLYFIIIKLGFGHYHVDYEMLEKSTSPVCLFFFFLFSFFARLEEKIVVPFFLSIYRIIRLILRCKYIYVYIYVYYMVVAFNHLSCQFLSAFLRTKSFVITELKLCTCTHTHTHTHRLLSVR